MKVTYICEKGCLGIKEFEFAPGNVTLIKGPKGVGKTSIVESLKMFFTNKSERPVFINSDSDKGEIILTFDDGTKGKKIYHKAGGTPYVSIEKDGMKPKAPESYLKSLISDVQINPISFIGQSEKEQTETVLSTISVSFTSQDIKKLFGEIPEAIDTGEHPLKICKGLENYYSNQRHDVNVDIKSVKADIANYEAQLPKGYNVEQWRNVKVSDVMKEINEATKHNEYVTNCNSLIAQADAQKQSINQLADEKVKSIQAEIDRLTKSIQSVNDDAAEKVKAVDEKVAK